MIVVGLTGSIAMGKSATAKMFLAEGIPVYDADAEVHKQYQPGGQAAALIAQRWPAVMTDGAVDRQKLSALVLKAPDVLPQLEALVHPIVARVQKEFLARHKTAGTPIVILDIPLLFEANRASEVDKIVVVSAPPDIQRSRALARPGMTEEKLDRILARQMPDEEKRARADFIVDTSRSLDHARAQVHAIVSTLRENQVKP